ncbi:hypothetical protein ACFX2I_007002 [Malus domestica]
MIVFHMQDYEFVPWRKFNEFAQLMEVQLRTILEELEVELGARRALAADVERLLANIGDQLFQKAPSPKKSVGTAWDIEKVLEDTKLDVTFLTFDVVLPNTALACDANDVTQSLMNILEFKLDADLGESQVMYLREEDDDMKVSEHNGQNEEGFEVNKVIGPSNFKPLLDKGIRQKRKGMQLVHPVTPFQGYKKKGIFSIVKPTMSKLSQISYEISSSPMWRFSSTS